MRSATQVAALPTLELLGRPTPLLEVAGSYRGPTDAVARPGTKLLAVCLTAPQALITVKMIGPAAVVDAQRAGFEHLLGRQSLFGAAA